MRFSGFDSCWHADQAASRRCYVSTCAGFLPVLAGAAAVTWERVQEVWGVGETTWRGGGLISRTYPNHCYDALSSAEGTPAEVHAHTVSLKSVKISQNRQCHVTFFDAQKVHAGVPQTGMCELRGKQNALYLSHCGECHDTEQAYKKHLTKARKLSSKGTALVQWCFYFLLWSEALEPDS